MRKHPLRRTAHRFTVRGGSLALQYDVKERNVRRPQQWYCAFANVAFEAGIIGQDSVLSELQGLSWVYLALPDCPPARIPLLPVAYPLRITERCCCVVSTGTLVILTAPDGVLFCCCSFTDDQRCPCCRAAKEENCCRR